MSGRPPAKYGTAWSREIKAGVTHCRIYVHRHITPTTTLQDSPFIATGFTNQGQITENGAPVAFAAATDDAAVQMMCTYLEQRFGIVSYRRVSVNPG